MHTQVFWKLICLLAFQALSQRAGTLPPSADTSFSLSLDFLLQHPYSSRENRGEGNLRREENDWPRVLRLPLCLGICNEGTRCS